MARRKSRIYHGAVACTYNPNGSLCGYIYFGAHAAYAQNTGGLSLLWRCEGVDPQNPSVIVMLGSTTSDRIEVYAETDNRITFVANRGGLQLFSITTTVRQKIGVYYHLVLSWGATGAFLQIDGVTVASTAINTLLNLGATPKLALGTLASGLGGANSLGGTYADMRLYGAGPTGAAPSESEAHAIYVDDADPSTPVARWAFSNPGAGGTSPVLLTSGSGNNGTITNGAWTRNVPMTRRRKARVFSGAVDLFPGFGNGRVDFGSHAAYKLSGSWAISHHFKPTDWPTSLILFSLQTGSLSDVIRVLCGKTTGELNLSLVKGGVTQLNSVGSSTLKYAPNQWVHILFCGDATTIKCYLDGRLAYSISADGSVAFPSNPTFSLGIPSGGNSHLGLVGETCLYNICPTDAQARDFYFDDIDPATPVARWAFAMGNAANAGVGPGLGTTVPLTSGTGNDGTITSGKWTDLVPMKPRRKSRVYPGAVACTYNPNGALCGYIYFGQHAAYAQNTGGASFVWRSEGVDPQNPSVVFQLGSTTSDRIEVFVDTNNYITLVANKGVQLFAITTTFRQKYGVYTHFTLSWGPGGAFLQADGVTIAKSNIDTTLNLGATPKLALGARTSGLGGANCIGGTFTDLRIYGGTAPTEDEARAIVFDNKDPSTPVSRWAFDDNTGTTVSLTSGSGNSGTITSGAWTSYVPMAQRNEGTPRILIQ
jgi:hypothetical protein